MEVAITANVCDQTTERLVKMLDKPLNTLSNYLSQDYGGKMEHLWIDFELHPGHAASRTRWPFRFQKTVSPPAMLRDFNLRKQHNVGHYSVRPDFDALLQLAPNQVFKYVLRLIYESTSVLADKRKRLGGFDTDRFRSEFLAGCRTLGHNIVGDGD